MLSYPNHTVIFRRETLDFPRSFESLCPVTKKNPSSQVWRTPRRAKCRRIYTWSIRAGSTPSLERTSFALGSAITEPPRTTTFFNGRMSRVSSWGHLFVLGGWWNLRSRIRLVIVSPWFLGDPRFFNGWTNAIDQCLQGVILCVRETSGNDLAKESCEFVWKKECPKMQLFSYDPFPHLKLARFWETRPQSPLTNSRTVGRSPGSTLSPSRRHYWGGQWGFPLSWGHPKMLGLFYGKSNEKSHCKGKSESKMDDLGV